MAAPLPAIVTAGQLAGLIGLTERSVIGRRSDGRLPATPEGKIDLRAVVRAGVDALAAQKKGEAGPGGIDQARIELLNEQRDRLRLLNAQMRAEAVMAEDVEAVVGAFADAVRAKVLALPTRAAPLLLGMESLAEITDKLTELATDACADLARREILSAVHHRAQRRAGGGEGGDADLSADEAAAAADDQPMG